MAASYVEIPSFDKDCNNDDVMRTITRVHDNSVELVIVTLDGPGMMTCQVLIDKLRAHRLRTRLIMCPQADAAHALAMRAHPFTQQHAAVIRIASGRMGAVLARPHAPRGCQALYADFCQTVTGSATQGAFPLEELSVFLKHNASKTEPVVFCCTFAAKLPKRLHRKHEDVGDIIVEKYLRPLWTHHKYREFFEEERVWSRTYQRTARSMRMVYVRAVIIHDSRMSNEARFIYRSKHTPVGYSSIATLA